MRLNLPIPIIKCNVRLEFLHDLKKFFWESQECIIFAAHSIPNRAITFSCMLANGVCYSQLPIHAFWKDMQDDKQIKKSLMVLNDLQLWNCFSYDMTCTQFDYLKDMRCEYLVKDKWVSGHYLMTFDWTGENTLACDTSFSEIPEDHKMAHMLLLDNGQFALQPNNRIKWFDKSFITEDFPQNPTYLANTRTWNVESSKEKTTGDFYYKVSSKE